MLACHPAHESWFAIESLTLTNCDGLFYCHPIMRNKAVAEELMSGMFLPFLLPNPASLSPPLQQLYPPKYPSLFHIYNFTTS